MNVRVRFMCIDIYAEKNDYDFELAEGATLDDALTAAASLPHVAVPLDEIRKSVLMVNSQRSELSRKLVDGDELIILRPLGGG